MNMPPNKIVTLLALLTPELVATELEVGALAQKCAEQDRDIDQLNNDKYDLRSEVERLNGELRSLNYLRSDLEYYKGRCEALGAQLSSYQHKEAMDRQKNMPESFLTYIVGEGRRTYESGNKIPCIKHVRELTGWGLKESKDFVEALVWVNVREGSTYYDKVTKEEVNSACATAKVAPIFTPEQIGNTRSDEPTPPTQDSNRGNLKTSPVNAS